MMHWILPLVFILAGLLGGIISEKIIFTRLKKFVASRRIPGSEIIFRSLNRMPFFWCVLAGFYGAMISYGPEPDVREFLRKIITGAFLYTVTVVFARLTAGFVNLFFRKTDGLSASLLSNVAKIAILVLGTLILLQTLGIEITPILTTLGVGGLAVGLALQDTLANLFSGFYLIISKQVRTGDYVKLADGNHEGYVTDITWRNTTIKELSNNVIIVPNSKLASAIFTNYHLPVKEITLTMNVGVGYDSDLEQVERVTVKVAKEVMQEIAPELIANEPYIRFHEFADFSINFTLYMRVNEFFDQRMARHLFIKKLHKRYQKEGIKIPFPIRDIYVQDNASRNGAMKLE
ncbi:mechanosensitive ion channel family protein [Tolypothrix campylonemoides VB511288]|nr:mechanosensitive ion channel family protein [Tolypothrix campylonemoides VB511288]